MYQGIFIDNQKTDKRFAKLMSTKGSLRVKFQKPTDLMALAKSIMADSPDLVALDYRLNKQAYKAGPLAQLLRDQALDTVTKDFPIILVPSENDYKAFSNNISTHYLFDRCFTKESFSNSSTHSLEILSLVKGYKHLIKHWDKAERWVTFLGVTRQEKIEVAYQAIRELDKLKAPHQVARDLLRYVIDRRGLLLDKYNVLAQLGVKLASSDVDKLFEILRRDKVKYTGVFSEGWARWWRHRLGEWGKVLCQEHLGNMTAKERVSCLNKKLGLKLSPAKSRWKNRTDTLVAFACDSCHQPTENQYSVIAYDPLPYTFTHSKYICWKCVETGEYREKGLEINEDEEAVVEMILKGDFK